MNDYDQFRALKIIPINQPKSAKPTQKHGKVALGQGEAW